MTKIPVANAQIEWEDDDDRRVTDIVIFDRINARPDEAARYHIYGSSAGACAFDWMTGVDSRSTPEGVFIQMARDGFASPDVMLQTLREFAKIDVCPWAETMADALELRLRVERR